MSLVVRYVIILENVISCFGNFNDVIKMAKKNKIPKKTQQKNLAISAIVVGAIILIYFVTIVKLSQVGVQI